MDAPAEDRINMIIVVPAADELPAVLRVCYGDWRLRLEAAPLTLAAAGHECRMELSCGVCCVR